VPPTRMNSTTQPNAAAPSGQHPPRPAKGTKRVLSSVWPLLIALTLVLAACGQTPPATLSPSPEVGWAAAAIGYAPDHELVEGQAITTSATNTITIRSAGGDIWGQQDAFVYLYTEITGNTTIQARLDHFDNVHEWSKAGLMIRESLAPDARNVLLHLTGEHGALLQTRQQTGGATFDHGSGGYDPTAQAGTWLRLTRNDNRITGELSNDGHTWRHLGHYDLTLDETALIGLAVAPNTPGQTFTATFSQLTLQAQPTTTTPQPQPDPDPEPEPQPDPEPNPNIPTSPDWPNLPPATLYVATNGNDNNDGRTTTTPLRTLPRAAAIAQPGDVIYIRGGTYSGNVTFNRSGTPTAPIIWTSHPGEWAILENARVTLRDSSHNILANFEIRNSPTIGLYISEAHDSILHGIVTHSNHGAGIYHYSGDRNRYQYVITFNNYDYNNAGENADGLSIASGSDNTIYRSLSYNNSDDGFDTWRSTRTLIDSSISFRNGRGDGGDGNGIKAGPGANTTIQNTITFENRATGIHHNGGSNGRYINNTSYNDNYAFQANSTTTLRNNIAIGGRLYLQGANSSHNTWDLNITNPQFISTDPTHPDFLALQPTSPAINTGTNVGLPYTGTAPDLGAIPHNQRITDITNNLPLPTQTPNTTLQATHTPPNP
jgi:hypothetical protein